MDYMIIEDSSNVPYTYKGSHDTYLKYGASAPKLDPAVQTAIVSRATEAVVVRVTAELRSVPKAAGRPGKRHAA